MVAKLHDILKQGFIGIDKPTKDDLEQSNEWMQAYLILSLTSDFFSDYRFIMYFNCIELESYVFKTLYGIYLKFLAAFSL